MNIAGRKNWKIEAGLAAATSLALTACNRGVLDPAGPVAGAEKQILINSTAIMLAIIIPTMIATIAFAWWFRAGNRRRFTGRTGNIRERSRWSCGRSPP